MIAKIKTALGLNHQGKVFRISLQVMFSALWRVHGMCTSLKLLMVVPKKGLKLFQYLVFKIFILNLHLFQFGFQEAFGGIGPFSNQFKTQYRCYSVSMLAGADRQDVDRGGKSKEGTLWYLAY